MRRQVYFSVLMTVGLFFFLFEAGNVPSEIYGDCLGWKACGDCHHEKADGWQKTRHSKAFDSLKKAGQADIPDCVVCHVVAYNMEGGFIDEELTPELTDVQCEACHGCGFKHVNLGQNPGGVIPSPSREVCRKCHTSGQHMNFKYNEMVVNVHGL